MYKRVREPRQVLLKKRDIEYQYIDMRNVDDLEEKLTSYSKADIKKEDSIWRKIVFLEYRSSAAKKVSTVFICVSII